MCRGDVCVSSCPRVYVQNVPVCTFKTPVSQGASLSSLLASLFSRVSLSLLLVFLSFFLFSLSNNDNDHSSSRLSLHAQL